MHPVASPYANKEGYFPAPDFAYGQQPPNGAYGQMREKVMRRRSVKQVELQGGHLVLDCPVPKSILTYAKDYPGGQPQEFTHMRYTAVTVDPDDVRRVSGERELTSTVHPRTLHPPPAPVQPQDRDGHRRHHVQRRRGPLLPLFHLDRQGPS